MDADATAADLALMQGDWRQVAFEQDGVLEPPETHGAPDSLTTIRGHHYCVFTVEGDLILEGSIELDVVHEPHTVLWMDDLGPPGQRSLRCIYRIDAEHFVFIGTYNGGPLPTDFHTRRGQMMRSLVRVHSSQLRQ